MGEIMTFEPTEAQFGVFWKYLQRPNVTDVDYNGSELWITDLKIGRYRVKEHDGNAGLRFCLRERARRVPACAG